MNDEQLQQRIRYLVEHGGLYDDPLSEIRRTARTAMWLAAGSCALAAVEIVQVLTHVHH